MTARQQPHWHFIPAAIAVFPNASTGFMALDLVLAVAGTTASWLNPIDARHQVPQTAGKRSTLKVATAAPRPPAIDPAAVDALLIEGLSVRYRRITDRLGQPLKWTL